MTRADIANVTLALRLLPDPQHRATLLRLAMGRPMSPTRYRATSRTGGALGQGLSDLKQFSFPLEVSASPRFRGAEKRQSWLFFDPTPHLL